MCKMYYLLVSLDARSCWSLLYVPLLSICCLGCLFWKDVSLWVSCRLWRARARLPNGVESAWLDYRKSLPIYIFFFFPSLKINMLCCKYFVRRLDLAKLTASQPSGAAEGICHQLFLSFTCSNGQQWMMMAHLCDTHLLIAWFLESCQLLVLEKWRSDRKKKTKKSINK